MSAPEFFRRACDPTVREIAAWTEAKTPDGADLDRIVTRVAPLDSADASSLAFFDNPRYQAQLKLTKAAACFVAPVQVANLPAGVIALITPQPYRAFAIAVAHLYPDALRPLTLFAESGVSPGSFVHPEARLEQGVLVDPGAVIGARAEIGTGTRICAQAVIGADVRIGRNCSIAVHASITNALIGDDVIIHPGVRIGQDGFGFAMSAQGHLKVPQIGRVIIQNRVEIGANTTIDRGATHDTVIGEGTQIDNLVQIAHNVTIGRNCVIVSQVGISGSTNIGDFVAIGGQAGLTGHLHIGSGAQIAAQSGVMSDIPPGEKWGGSPARPMQDWLRGQAAVNRLARKKSRE